jgi:cell division protein FtsZ
MKSHSSPIEELDLKPRILVVGVGGAGGNAVNNMIRSKLEGVDFLAMNTDAQALQHSLAPTRLQLGLGVTRGLGAGSKPDVGKSSAEETLEEIMGPLNGCNMVFITAGMGGGTGTGAAPVIARVAREMGILTIGVVTKPFQFEGSHRMRMAEQGIAELQQYVDTLIVIPNQNLFRVANERTTFADAFKMADDVLYSGVRGITDLMIMPGLINLDFADVRAVMGEKGKAMMGTGEAEGEGRALQAAEAAISNPLLDDVSMKGARGVLISITGGYDMTLYEADEAANRIREEVDSEANIIFGATFDEKLVGCMRISIVATGIDAFVPMHAQSLPANKPFLSAMKEPPASEASEAFMTVLEKIRGTSESEEESQASAQTDNQKELFDDSLQTDFFADEKSYDLQEPIFDDAEMESLHSDESTDKGKKLSLFERLTGVGRRAQAERMRSSQKQSLGPKEASVELSNQEDDLEIPAFLRRQDGRYK